jgi:hypothetical protein
MDNQAYQIIRAALEVHKELGVGFSSRSIRRLSNLNLGIVGSHFVPKSECQSFTRGEG